MIAGVLVVLLALSGAAPHQAPPAQLDLAAIDRLIAAGSFGEAEQASRALAESLGARGEVDTLRVADVLDRWAASLYQLQRSDAASRDVALRAIRIREARAGADSPDLPIPYTILASIEDIRGDYAATLAAAERAAAIAERAWAADDPRFGRVMTALAAGLFQTGAFDRADPVYRRALAIEERLHPTAHVDLVRVIHSYGLYLGSVGRFAEALPLLERAVVMREQLGGPDALNVAVSLNALGVMSFNSGDYVGARAALTRSLDIRRRRLGPDHVFIAQTELWLATLAKDLGDYDTAKAGYERGLAMVLRVAPAHRFVPLFRIRLGDLYIRLGDYAAAEAVIEPAVADLTTRNSSNNDLTGWAMRAAAELRYAIGDFPNAVVMGRRALEVLARQRGDTDLDTGLATRVLARALARTGAIGEALPLYQRAIQILDTAVGPSHPETTETRSQFAQLLLDNGRGAEAAVAALAAERAGREQARLTVRALPERQATLYATAARHSLHVVVDAAERGAANPRDALDAVIRARALVLDELGRRRVLVRAGGADQAPLERALADARERLARLVVRGPDTLPAAQYSALVAQARDAGERAEEALAAVSARQRDERRERQVGFAEVRDALPPQSTLLSYVRYTHRAAAIASERYGVFVTARDQEPRFVALGAANAVDAAISAVRAQILREASTPGRSARLNEAAYRRAAATLRQLVWDPVSAHISGASKVFIVTDGSLGLVNFDALPVGDARYVIDGPATRHYLTAERDLAKRAPASASRTLLTLGDPDFDGRDTVVTKAPAVRRGAGTPCSDFASLRFDRLPASASETAAIASLWKPAAAIQLLGANASKASLKQLAPGARIIHLATHGFFLGEGCAGDNPLLLSGLAFAGANGRASTPADGDDGMLTSEEIATMDLSGVEWAVLSACDTGLGSIVAGEGVLGLQRAFQLAGTATVIMSLWPIDDRSTERWMTALYDERLTRQQPTAEAVRAADRRMLAERRRDGRSTHPFYWAAFVATGDWR